MLALANPTTNAKKLNSPVTSVVLLNFNGAPFIRNCLNSILNINYPFYEVIFVDNGSRDNSLEIVKKEFKHVPNIKILELGKNMGYALGNNIGARHADKNSKYLLFLNVDTEVTPNFLKELTTIMENNPQIGAAQPKLLLAEDKKCIDSMGAFIDIIGTVYNIGGLEKDRGQYDKIIDVFYAKGAAFIIRRQLFEEVGEFDEDFFLWRDEVDLCWRIWLHGFKVLTIPSSTVYHYGSAIIKKTFSNPAMEYFFTKNNILMLVKNYSLGNIVRFLPLYILFQALMTVHNTLKSNNTLYVKSFCNAVIWNFLNLGETLIKRFEVQKIIRRVRDEELIGRVISPKPFLFIKLKKLLN